MPKSYVLELRHQSLGDRKGTYGEPDLTYIDLWKKGHLYGESTLNELDMTDWRTAKST